MNKSELTDALSIAQSNVDLTGEAQPFDGFGLPEFKPTACTRRQVARLIRWQCIQFNGQLDAKALEEIRFHGRKKFIVVG